MGSKKQKRIRLGLIIYFVSAAIIFIVGRYMIIIQYNIDTGPVKDGGFELLINWVSIFALLFIIPLAILTVLGGCKLIRQCNNNPKTLTPTLLMFSVVPFVAIASFVLFWAFILAFYGFAP